MACLTFIIPIRHQDNSDKWELLVRNLKQTVQSICAQSHPDWKCVVVANHGAQLPDLPKKFEVCYVDFPPNDLYIQGSTDLEVFRDAVRLDKGKRLLAGIKHAGDCRYLMFVDDDDLIHCDLTKFVCDHEGGNGWYIDKGLIWQDGSRLLMNYDRFYLYCGTSHIFRFNLLDRVEIEKIEYIKRMLGSHMHLKNEFDNNQTPLKSLPFRGAIYRVGHSDAHSKSPGIIRTFIFTKRLLKSPRVLLGNLFAIRWLTPKLRRTYFGVSG